MLASMTFARYGLPLMWTLRAGSIYETLRIELSTRRWQGEIDEAYGLQGCNIVPKTLYMLGPKSISFLPRTVH